jgi:lipopolysaccharide transport system ATP-binding protein
MPDTVIKVDSLSKLYRLGSGDTGYKTFRETLVDSAKAPFLRLRDAGRYLKNSLLHAPGSMLPDPGSPLPSQGDDLFWALKDVSFEVKRGEVVGVIGRNGAGKSTLLKILSKITEPTEGRIELRGRVGSLLEVGTGFHPELTGHENVYLYGAILGMDRWEITRKFDEIIAFAELEKFIDTPVKRYSSGMYMRLAFAVAAHLEPEILLIDEVLAVGDTAFQKKCLGKMDAISKEGRTILFVSHNMGAIRKLCNTCIFLDAGKIGMAGSPSECIKRYTSNVSETRRLITDHISELNNAIKIDRIMANDTPYDQLEISGETRTLKIEIIGHTARILHFDLELRIYDLYENPLAFFSPGHQRGSTPEHKAGPFSLIRHIELPKMNKGTYFISIFITTPNVTGWASIPYGIRLEAEGFPTSTGQVFDCYKQGTGWIMLSEPSTAQ